MSTHEISKQLFQRYCGIRGYSYKCVPTSNQRGIRTPDFDVTANGVRIIAEAKDLTANSNDVRDWQATFRGEVVVHCREPGKRARDLIERARGQLRASADTGIPSVVVAFDNITVDGKRVHTSPYSFTPLSATDVDVALYGLWQANVRFHPGSKVESLVDTRSRYRKIPAREIISAVAVLYEGPHPEGLFALVYHNYWARSPLPRNVFDGECDYHFKKGNNPDVRPENWIRF